MCVFVCVCVCVCVCPTYLSAEKSNMRSYTLPSGGRLTWKPMDRTSTDTPLRTLSYTMLRLLSCKGQWWDGEF